MCKALIFPTQPLCCMRGHNGHTTRERTDLLRRSLGARVFWVARDRGVEELGFALFTLTSLLLYDYDTCGGMPCLRKSRCLGVTGIRAPLCSTRVVPGSLLAVAIGADSPSTTVPFGLAMTAPVATGDGDLADRPSLRRCLMSGGKGVSFPILNALRVNNLAGDRTRGVVGRGLGACVGRGPVIGMHVTGCGVSIVKRMTRPNAFAVAGRGMGVVRTLTVTKSVAMCKRHSGIGLVHRSTRNGHRIVPLGLGSTSVVMSPCCCLRRGSIICIAPGGAGTGGTDVDGDAAV